MLRSHDRKAHLILNDEFKNFFTYEELIGA